ncbi:MAG: flavin reductase family protein [Bacteroidota bacterium]|nr:flavin reductase family protein [Bacteroidota bacterium]MDP4214618.1 flavin reductase family protein [Bacteroidota bacterium]MDP4247297.1 flavin reductase family protein [Bacteroidota bacterium]MDP4255343.1 flavin reductase family protein [Bacteroidota bacterium]
MIHFKTIDPKILYFGTPVALITTVGEEGKDNIGPMSSVWALGWTLMLGLECGSKTYQNLVAQEECVINFPSAGLFKQVEKIANLTGMDPVPEYKRGRYQYASDKFKVGSFTRIPSELVAPPRIAECQIQMEAVLKNVTLIEDDPKERSSVAAMETRVVRVHVDEHLLIENQHINPVNWDPLIYNFRHYYGLGEELGKTFKAEV